MQHHTKLRSFSQFNLHQTQTCLGGYTEIGSTRNHVQVWVFVSHQGSMGLMTKKSTWNVHSGPLQVPVINGVRTPINGLINGKNWGYNPTSTYWGPHNSMYNWLGPTLAPIPMDPSLSHFLASKRGTTSSVSGPKSAFTSWRHAERQKVFLPSRWAGYLKSPGIRHFWRIPTKITPLQIQKQVQTSNKPSHFGGSNRWSWDWLSLVQNKFLKWDFSGRRASNIVH